MLKAFGVKAFGDNMEFFQTKGTEMGFWTGDGQCQEIQPRKVDCKEIADQAVCKS